MIAEGGGLTGQEGYSPRPGRGPAPKSARKRPLGLPGGDPTPTRPRTDPVLSLSQAVNTDPRSRKALSRPHVGCLAGKHSTSKLGSFCSCSLCFFPK